MPEARQAIYGLSQDIRRAYQQNGMSPEQEITVEQADEAAEALYYRLGDQVNWSRVLIESMQMHAYHTKEKHEYHKGVISPPSKDTCGHCIREAVLNIRSLYSFETHEAESLVPPINRYMWATRIVHPTMKIGKKPPPDLSWTGDGP